VTKRHRVHSDPAIGVPSVHHVSARSPTAASRYEAVVVIATINDCL
jgi:hypothetical protein